MSAPVNTASTPSIAAAACVDRRIRPWATSLRLKAMCSIPASLDVVDVGGLALDEARIFAALDARANQFGEHGGHYASPRRRGVDPRFPAACWTALTMCW